MSDSISNDSLKVLPDEGYSITWTSERLNRLLLHNREIHLWSDFHNFNEAARKLWSSEQCISLSREEAIEVIVEWVSNGPFLSHERDLRRIPGTIRERLKPQMI